MLLQYWIQYSQTHRQTDRQTNRQTQHRGPRWTHAAGNTWCILQPVFHRNGIGCWGVQDASINPQLVKQTPPQTTHQEGLIPFYSPPVGIFRTWYEVNKHLWFEPESRRKIPSGLKTIKSVALRTAKITAAEQHPATNQSGPSMYHIQLPPEAFRRTTLLTFQKNTKYRHAASSKNGRKRTQRVMRCSEPVCYGNVIPREGHR